MAFEWRAAVAAWSEDLRLRYFFAQNLGKKMGWPLIAENFGRFYLSTVRCAVKSNTSSRRRRQLHPASLCYAATSKCNGASAEWNDFTSKSERCFSEERLRRVKMWSRTWRLSEVKTFVFVIFLPGIWAKKWGEWRDLNSRPSGPQPDALTSWATTTIRLLFHNIAPKSAFFKRFFEKNTNYSKKCEKWA